MSILFYRRPDYVSKTNSPINASDCAKYMERARGSERSIPSGLSFEEVINNKPLPPCSLNDFMDYLVYVEHSAENLQFYLWYQDYARRWNELPKHEQALSPEVKPDQTDFPNLTGENGPIQDKRLVSARPKVCSEAWNAAGLSFFLDEQDANEDGDSIFTPSYGRTATPNDADIATQAGLKWQPFTVQPYREECNQVVRHYLALNSPRELNLSHRDRVLLLHALQHTTHPSAFAPALKVADATLRSQSHQNFIRWSICNGNKPRIVAVRCLGGLNTFAGFLIAMLLTLSHVSRWYRLFALGFWFIGLSTLVASFKGLCIILHHSHRRHLRPWELDRLRLDSSSAPPRTADSGRASNASSAGGRTTRLAAKMRTGEDGNEEWGMRSPSEYPSSSMDTFGPENEWRKEEWVGIYEREPLLRRVFQGRCVWTQEETLRVLQDRIVLGAHLWGCIMTMPIAAAFVALPVGGFY